MPTDRYITGIVLYVCTLKENKRPDIWKVIARFTAVKTFLFYLWGIS